MENRLICSGCKKSAMDPREVETIFVVEEPGFFICFCDLHNHLPESRERNKAIMKGTEKHDLVCKLLSNSRLFQLFSSLTNKISQSIVKDIQQKQNLNRNSALFTVITEPKSLLQMKDKDRIFRFVRKAGIQYPNEFVSEEDASELLCQMLKRRVSVSVIENAFERWPNSTNIFKPLRAIIMTKNSQFEKKLLLEMLLPYYVHVSLRKNPEECMRVISTLPDLVLKRIVLSFITYLQRLYVLKAMELNPLTQRLPRNLRRYMVEMFFTYTP